MKRIMNAPQYDTTSFSYTPTTSQKTTQTRTTATVCSSRGRGNRRNTYHREQQHHVHQTSYHEQQKLLEIPPSPPLSSPLVQQEQQQERYFEQNEELLKGQEFKDHSTKMNRDMTLSSSGKRGKMKYYCDADTPHNTLPTSHHHLFQPGPKRQRQHYCGHGRGRGRGRGREFLPTQSGDKRAFFPIQTPLPSHFQGAAARNRNKECDDHDLLEKGTSSDCATTKSASTDDSTAMVEMPRSREIRKRVASESANQMNMTQARTKASQAAAKAYQDALQFHTAGGNCTGPQMLPQVPPPHRNPGRNVENQNMAGTRSKASQIAVRAYQDGLPYQTGGGNGPQLPPPALQRHSVENQNMTQARTKASQAAAKAYQDALQFHTGGGNGMCPQIQPRVPPPYHNISSDVENQNMTQARTKASQAAAKAYQEALQFHTGGGNGMGPQIQPQVPPPYHNISSDVESRKMAEALSKASQIAAEAYQNALQYFIGGNNTAPQILPRVQPPQRNTGRNFENSKLAEARSKASQTAAKAYQEALQYHVGVGKDNNPQMQVAPKANQEALHYHAGVGNDIGPQIPPLPPVPGNGATKTIIKPRLDTTETGIDSLNDENQQVAEAKASQAAVKAYQDTLQAIGAGWCCEGLIPPPAPPQPIFDHPLPPTGYKHPLLFPLAAPVGPDEYQYPYLTQEQEQHIEQEPDRVISKHDDSPCIDECHHNADQSIADDSSGFSAMQPPVPPTSSSTIVNA